MVTFPIDFFEHCQAMNEVEFGGNDLLQIYNTQQIKHRLNTTGNNTLVWKMVEALGAHGEECINFMKYSVIMEDTIWVSWTCERIILTLWCQN